MNEFEKAFADYISKHDNPQFTKFHFAARVNEVKMGKVIFAEGLDINMKDMIFQKHSNIIFNEENFK